MVRSERNGNRMTRRGARRLSTWTKRWALALKIKDLVVTHMQTTRLHISGLTPSISANDLKQRFSTFGDVRDIDGVGKLDGVGE
jgi:hypothetical protein